MTSSPSSWRVSFDSDDGYMWQCLLYFIGLGLAPHPLPLAEPSGPVAQEHPETGSSTSSTSSAPDQGKGPGAQQQRPPSERSANFPGWVRRARERKPMLQADNVDLLFQLRGGGSGGGLEEDVSDAAQRRRQSARVLAGTAAGAMLSRGGGGKGSSPGVREEGAGAKTTTLGDEEGEAAAAVVKDNAFLEFVAPGKVEVRHEELDGEEAVGEGQVLVQAICSSISSGTELKVCQRRMMG